LGRVEELGSGVRNVTCYLQAYRPDGQAEFIQEDVFRTIVPIPVNGPISILPVPTLVDSLAEVDKLKITVAVKQRLRHELQLLSAAQLTAAAVASQLSVEVRTVRRDIQLLRDTGLLESGVQYGSYQLRQ
jgi:ATP-dependent DNA helicase RecG